jgi:hypothetical protein
VKETMMPYVVMERGKYKGERIVKVPFAYLVACAYGTGAPAWRQAIRDELHRRQRLRHALAGWTAWPTPRWVM